jgi:hypothetical protein
VPAPTPKTLIEVKTLARAYTEHSINVLAGIASTSTSDAARVAAATALLDRGWGRPKQVVEHGGEDGNDIKITIRQIIEAKKIE